MPKLAATLRKIANDTEGIAEFYTGTLARDISEEIPDGGMWLF